MSYNEIFLANGDYDMDGEKFIKQPTIPTKKELLLAKKKQLLIMKDRYDEEHDKKGNKLFILSFTLATIDIQFMIDLIDIMLIDL